MLLSSSRLSLRTLELTDVPEGASVPFWYGDKERRAHLWEPPLETVQYLRGLVTACDQKARFAFLIQSAAGEPLGLLKAQLLSEGSELIVVPSVVLGDDSRDGQRLGSDAVGLFIHFAIQHAHATRVSLRFYEENQTSRHLAEAYGYTHTRTDQEKSSQGTRQVLVYEISAADWLARNSARVVDFRREL